MSKDIKNVKPVHNDATLDINLSKEDSEINVIVPLESAFNFVRDYKNTVFSKLPF
jgi:hypothetical protein